MLKKIGNTVIKVKNCNLIKSIIKCYSSVSDVKDDKNEFKETFDSINKLISYKENISMDNKINKIIFEITKSNYKRKDDKSVKNDIYKFLLREINQNQIESLFSILIKENSELLEKLSDMLLSREELCYKVSRNSLCLILQNLINLKKFDKAFFYFVITSLNGIKHTYLISNNLFLQISFDYKFNLLNKAKDNLKVSKSKSISTEELNQMNLKMENDQKIHFLKKYMKRNYSNQDFKNSLDTYNRLKGKNLDQIYKDDNKDDLKVIGMDEGGTECRPM